MTPSQSYCACMTDLHADISPGAFSELDNQRERRHPKFRVRRYIESLSLLVITVPTSPLHEPLHRTLWFKIQQSIEDMGLGLSWIEKGNTTFRSGGDAAEGDSAGGPAPERAGARGWPTLVVEAGVSETVGQLREDGRWWFVSSGHQVKIVLLARLVVSERMIILEKWTGGAPVHPTVGPITRAAAQVRPQLDQAIIITGPTRSSDPATFVVHGAEALRLEFDLLFLQRPGMGEGDVILDADALRGYAARAWLAADEF
jgi:hypothetical protein